MVAVWIYIESQDARKSQANKPTCKTGSQIPYCSHKPECIGTTNPDRSVLITILTWQFPFNPVNVSNLHVKGTFVRGSLFPLLRHVVPLNDGPVTRKMYPFDDVIMIFILLMFYDRTTKSIIFKKIFQIFDSIYIYIVLLFENIIPMHYSWR